MPRCPFAEWRGPVPNKRLGGMDEHPHGLVPHVIVGSLASADAEFKNPKSQLSAHFGVAKGGHLVQWVDTQDVAWAEAAGNSHWWSCECEGVDTEPHTPAQLDTLAVLTVWLRTLSPFTLQVTDDVHGYGITSHRCGGKAWGGHSCPGDKRHAQRADIVLRAHALEQPHPSPFPPSQPIVNFPGDHMQRIPVSDPTNPLGAAGTGFWDLDGGHPGRPRVAFSSLVASPFVNGADGFPANDKGHNVEPYDHGGNVRLRMWGFEPGAVPLIFVPVGT
jgi:hypothetical protein